MIRLATWNLRHGRPRSGLASNRALRRTLGDLDVDVACLQEVDHRVVRSWFRHQGRLAGRALAPDAAWRFAAARRVGVTGRDGVAVALRGAIGAATPVRLPRFGPGQDRVLLVVEAVVGERELTVATTHLQNEATQARGQLTAAAELLAARSGPVVLAGDLNLCAADAVEVLGPFGFTVVDGAATEPAWAPVQRIDHVAVRGITADEVAVPAVPVSDHRPVVVRLA